MSLSTPFIRRPVATTLLTLGVLAAGAVAFFQLPVSPLPKVDYPTISVRAQLPGASPEVVATSVATPLERHLGQIADVTEMTSTSAVGTARITLQFGLNRDINGAARDVQAAINAARVDLPASLRSNPTYRKVNPADAPILILALTSDTLRQAELYDAASTVLSQKLSQVEGIGEVTVGGSSLPAVRVELNPSALVILNRAAGANITDTVDRVYALLPVLQAAISPAIELTAASDRSTTIRSSLKEVERTLMISVALVILVVFLFLRSGRATLVPSVAVPVSLIGTFAAMYLLGYSLYNLSLMALTVATGFVVDDAIVVLENVSRHIEAGVPRVQAAIRGAGEVAFTVISMSTSLIAVFIPILLMGGIVGRLFREFAVTLSVAIMISLAVSLATTPMMCALLLKRSQSHEQGRFHRMTERFFDAMLGGYRRTLAWALDHPRLVASTLLATVVTNFY